MTGNVPPPFPFTFIDDSEFVIFHIMTYSNYAHITVNLTTAPSSDTEGLTTLYAYSVKSHLGPGWRESDDDRHALTQGKAVHSTITVTRRRARGLRAPARAQLALFLRASISSPPTTFYRHWLYNVDLVISTKQDCLETGTVGGLSLAFGGFGSI
ncbi:hypothetical protein ARMSODRAFT_979117 [Armillaria solidipes]|uniref:Uncharacterized protein n=1 Tax=Armillaria solidipes TaxID=1076256 RepID=A0A2H3BMJ3_9AGAR|nr:hypothetical protein ARMSODRAFT_979117 [Armillaria solidipes]